MKFVKTYTLKELIDEYNRNSRVIVEVRSVRAWHMYHVTIMKEILIMTVGYNAKTDYIYTNALRKDSDLCEIETMLDNYAIEILKTL